MPKTDQIEIGPTRVVEISRAGDVAVDHLVSEAPLQITLNGRRFSVLMRTPNTDEASDVDLTVGFLVSEGIIEDWDDLDGIAYCSDPLNTHRANSMIVQLRSGCPLPEVLRTAKRATVVSSSCGVCGRMDMDALTPDFPDRPQFEKPSDSLIKKLPDRLRAAQRIFELTGGIHGAGLVDESGCLLFTTEDIGRHNAMDKLVGRALRLGIKDLRGGIVVVSSRISFDLVQKALMAGISTLVGVGAASDLAHRLAQQEGLHLFSFTKVSTTNYHPQS